MEEITEIDLALDYLLEHIGSTEVCYITTAAHDQILRMQVSLEENFSFKLPDTNELLESLIIPDCSELAAMGVVLHSQNLAFLYISVVSIMLKRGDKSMSLLQFLRLFLAMTCVDNLAIRREEDSLFLVGSPDFERQHQIRLRMRIPEPK